MFPTQAVIASPLFIALVLFAAMQGLAASGHFPRTVGRAGPGPAVLFGSMALALASLAGGTTAALRFTPWYAAIIGGGLAVLAAPLVLQLFPDRFVDGHGALVVLSCAAAAFAIVLIAWAI